VEHHGETEVLGLIQVDFSYCDAPWLGAPRAVLLIMSREFPLGSLLPTAGTMCYLVIRDLRPTDGRFVEAAPPPPSHEAAMAFLSYPPCRSSREVVGDLNTSQATL
jgi:hypothetical protein